MAVFGARNSISDGNRSEKLGNTSLFEQSALNSCRWHIACLRTKYADHGNSMDNSILASAIKKRK